MLGHIAIRNKSQPKAKFFNNARAGQCSGKQTRLTDNPGVRENGVRHDGSRRSSSCPMRSSAIPGSRPHRSRFLTTVGYRRRARCRPHVRRPSIVTRHRRARGASCCTRACRTHGRQSKKECRRSFLRLPKFYGPPESRCEASPGGLVYRADRPGRWQQPYVTAAAFKVVIRHSRRSGGRNAVPSRSHPRIVECVNSGESYSFRPSVSH